MLIQTQIQNKEKEFSKLCHLEIIRGNTTDKIILFSYSKGHPLCKYYTYSGEKMRNGTIIIVVVKEKFTKFL